MSPLRTFAPPRFRSPRAYQPRVNSARWERLRALQAQDRAPRQHEGASGRCRRCGHAGCPVRFPARSGRRESRRRRRNESGRVTRPHAGSGAARPISATALEPSEPSGPDLALSARAAQMVRKADAELTAGAGDANAGLDTRSRASMRTAAPAISRAASRPRRRRRESARAPSGSVQRRRSRR